MGMKSVLCDEKAGRGHCPLPTGQELQVCHLCCLVEQHLCPVGQDVLSTGLVSH